MADELEERPVEKTKNFFPLYILAGVAALVITGALFYKKSKQPPKVYENPDEQAVAAKGLGVRQETEKAMEGADQGKFATGGKFDQYGNYMGTDVTDVPTNMNVEELTEKGHKTARSAGTSAGDVVGAGIDSLPYGHNASTSYESQGNFSGAARNAGRMVQSVVSGGGGTDHPPMLGYSMDDAGRGNSGGIAGVGRTIGASIRGAGRGGQDDDDMEARLLDRTSKILAASGATGGLSGPSPVLPGGLAAGARTGAANGPLRSQPGETANMLGGGPGPQFKVPEGRFLDCVVTRRVVGDVNDSPVHMIVTRDFISRDGKWVLFPAGSEVLAVAGMVQAQQQTRMFLKCHKFTYPNERTVYFPEHLLPQGLNPDGALGVEGKVNRHFWLQFGAAIGLGVVEGFAASNSDQVTQSQATGVVQMSARQYAISKAGDRMGQVVDRMLDKYTNVLPTITLNPGQRVKVYFSEDVLVNGYMPTEGLRWVGSGH